MNKKTDGSFIPLDTTVIPLFDEILNCACVKGLCRRCGNSATHSLIYCKNRGDKFFRPAEPMKLIRATEIVSHSNGTGGNYYKPDYQAAIHKLRIKRYGYTEKDFIEYCNKKLEVV